MSELQAWLAAAPAGTLVNAQALAQALAVAGSDTGQPPAADQPPSWMERLWTAPPETRIGVVELCEAVGRTRSWVWRHTGANGNGARLPHRKLDGELIFVVGEVRTWLTEHERVVVPPGLDDVVVTRKRGA